MKRILPIVWILIGGLLLSFIGVKNHPSQGHRMVIVKHRPSLKIEYYSPIGDSKKLLEELSPEEQKEELLYREFVKRPESHTIDNIALVFFQLGIYLIVLNLLKLIFFRRKYRFKMGRFISLNVIGVAIAMGVYQIYWTKDMALWVAVLGQVILNMVLIFPRLRKNA
ncbi:hypothetical protein [Aureispira sp. CCB-E]|uniref:hypothetical protein n=1 Tax=Aureispira sp. CCB-E TaxID=3051121 RepID=UPI0028689426|nr:hypothetical protein [Aureispira sp. CCB-E]WMX14665.1 hypothetical protein QP953_27785 [Aureispira sp. CCB-E]